MYKFKVWYKDGTTFEGEGEDIYKAPTLDVQAIVQNEPKGWHIVSHCKVYLWEDDMRFYGGDWFDLFQWFSRPMRNRVALFGSTMDTEEFLGMIADAKSHQDHELYQEAHVFMSEMYSNDYS